MNRGERQTEETGTPEAMGYDENTAGRVRQILSVQRDVVEKKMVGGLCFMVNGSMCCGVASAGLLVRVGPDALESNAAKPHVRTMEMGGRRLAGFVFVDPVGYRSDAALAAWVQRGIDFVSTLPPKKKAVTKPRRNRRRGHVPPPENI